MCLNKKELLIASNSLYIKKHTTNVFDKSNIQNSLSDTKPNFNLLLGALMKELPYFRFYVTEYLLDDISDQDLSVQGLFIKVCAYYWFKNCDVSKQMLKQKYSNCLTELETLYDCGILKVKASGETNIKFLDEQFEVLSGIREKRAIAGAKGGSKSKAIAKQTPKQNASYKYKYKDNYKNNKYTDVFESFWSDIPKRSGSSKSQSFKIWQNKRIGQDKELLNLINESIPKYKRAVKTKYYAKVETWLNQERWTAEYNAPKNNNSRRAY